ncbi:XdhC family protein [Clostridium sp. D2Q-14]|uniref:XdhC family protein n=1 Tax=Anaeromonas gelatinilytica TaxID=2683194 RepID=UPI00193BB5C4|nr:XdhC/CoxI family protein [Anaeromonas gelatinilytica]MBS4536709.1 XdhC family protein [Anaeromonas gelatinilytica]
MDEIQYIEKINEEMKNNRSVAMATTISVKGSTPREEGSIMIVMEDGTTIGTIGGGKLEYEVIKEAKICIEKGESKKYDFKLTDKGDLGAVCGGQGEVFIKVFKKKENLILVGGGHVGRSIYHMAQQLDFNIIVVDEREEICNRQNFPKAQKLLLGDVKEELNKYLIDSFSYIVIATKGHKDDEKALEAVLDRGAKYIGLIGSKIKLKYTFDNLLEKGFKREDLQKVYAPVGLNLGGEIPEEIALSILSEIVLVRNNGTPKHMKYDFFVK